MTESVHFIASSSFKTEPEFFIDFVNNEYRVNNPTGVDAQFIAGAKFESVFVAFERLTESGDTRITESSDTRITEDTSENSAVATLISIGNKIPFNSELYVKYLSNFKIATPYIRHNDSWIVPISIYRYSNNAWKRIN
jgi:hypothetical protein